MQFNPQPSHTKKGKLDQHYVHCINKLTGMFSSPISCCSFIACTISLVNVG